MKRYEAPVAEMQMFVAGISIMLDTDNSEYDPSLDPDWGSVDWS